MVDFGGYFARGGRVKVRMQSRYNKKGTYNGKLVTVKKSNDICPFTHMLVEKGHRNRRLLDVNGREVVIFGNKLVNRFKQIGIAPPVLEENTRFHIVPFLRKEVMKALKEKPCDMAISKMAVLIRFGFDLGINVNISKQIALKTK